MNFRKKRTTSSCIFIHLVLGDLDVTSTTDLTGPPGGDETDLPTRRGSPLDGRWVTNMLMVTTTVGMLDGVHGHTSDLGPAVPLDSVLVVSSAGLEHGLVATTATSDDADDGPVLGGVELLDAGGQLDPGSAGVGVVGDDGAVAAGSLGDLAAVAGLLLHGASDGTLRHLSDGEDVTDVELSLLTAVDELTGGDTLGGDHDLGSLPVLVRVVEGDPSEGSTTAGVVHDVLDETLDESMPLGKVEGPELGGTLSSGGDGGEDGAGALSLSTDDPSHF